MKKIMFICTGNICRSAMAEGLMKKLVQENKKDCLVYSSGLYAEDGEMPTYNAIHAIGDYDVDIREHRATSTINSDIKNMDIILCATQNHKRACIQMYPELKEKIFTIKEFAGYDKNDLDIPDPWGYDLETYRFCAGVINKCLQEIIKKI